MRLLRPFAAVGLARCARLLACTLALVLATLGSETLGAQTYTSNLRGYVRTPAGLGCSGRHARRRDQPATRYDDERHRLLLHRRTEARAV